MFVDPPPKRSILSFWSLIAFNVSETSKYQKHVSTLQLNEGWYKRPLYQGITNSALNIKLPPKVNLHKRLKRASKHDDCPRCRLMEAKYLRKGKKCKCKCKVKCKCKKIRHKEKERLEKDLKKQKKLKKKERIAKKKEAKMEKRVSKEQKLLERHNDAKMKEMKKERQKHLGNHKSEPVEAGRHIMKKQWKIFNTEPRNKNHGPHKLRRLIPHYYDTGIKINDRAKFVDSIQSRIGLKQFGASFDSHDALGHIHFDSRSNNLNFRHSRNSYCDDDSEMVYKECECDCLQINSGDIASFIKNRCPEYYEASIARMDYEDSSKCATYCKENFELCQKQGSSESCPKSETLRFWNNKRQISCDCSLWFMGTGYGCEPTSWFEDAKQVFSPLSSWEVNEEHNTNKLRHRSDWKKAWNIKTDSHSKERWRKLVDTIPPAVDIQLDLLNRRKNGPRAMGSANSAKTTRKVIKPSATNKRVTTGTTTRRSLVTTTRPSSTKPRIQPSTTKVTKKPSTKTSGMQSSMTSTVKRSTATGQSQSSVTSTVKPSTTMSKTQSNVTRTAKMTSTTKITTKQTVNSTKITTKQTVNSTKSAKNLDQGSSIDTPVYEEESTNETDIEEDEESTIANEEVSIDTTTEPSITESQYCFTTKTHYHSTIVTQAEPTIKSQTFDTTEYVNPTEFTFSSEPNDAGETQQADTTAFRRSTLVPMTNMKKVKPGDVIIDKEDIQHVKIEFDVKDNPNMSPLLPKPNENGTVVLEGIEAMKILDKEQKVHTPEQAHKIKGKHSSNLEGRKLFKAHLRKQKHLRDEAKKLSYTIVNESQKEYEDFTTITIAKETSTITLPDENFISSTTRTVSYSKGCQETTTKPLCVSSDNGIVATTTKSVTLEENDLLYNMIE